MTELRYAIRALTKTPVISLVVILSLGLGIGANTAIFSLMHQALMKSLPVEKPEELVLLNSPADLKGGRSSSNNAGGMDSIFSYLTFRGLERNPAGVKGVAAYRLLGANIAFQGKTLNGGVSVVSGGYFPLLGVQPHIGRMLSYEDDRGAGQSVAVLSYGYWQDKLGARSDVLNQPLRVNGQVFTVVGVAPKGFLGMTLGDEPDVYVPLVFKPAMTPGWNGTDRWNDYYLYLLARLQPGSTAQAAESALNGIYNGLKEEQLKSGQVPKSQAERFRESRLKLLPGAMGQSSLRKGMETPLRILLICTGLVLLIAAGNAANLLLARAVQRSKELSIRVAMGASSLRILKQMLGEAMLLSVAGGAAGLLIGVWILDVLISTLSGSDETVYYLTAHLDPPVLLFTMAVVVLTGLIFGLYPAWTAARVSLAGNLKEESNQSSASRGGVRVRKALVTAQVALSVLLLIPTGLFLKSLVNLMHVNLGIRTENLLTFRVSPELNGYKPEQCLRFYQRAEENLRSIPGVQSVTVAMVPLIGGSRWGNDVDVEGFQKGPNVDNNSMYNVVGAGFFGKMGVPLIKGRELTESDTETSPRVAVVNETWVKHFAPSREPIGLRMRIGDAKTYNVEIVGVVKDTKYAGVKDEAFRLYYLPYRQEKDTGEMSFYVRSGLPVEQLSAMVRRTMSGLDPNLPLENLRTMEAQVQRNIRADRLVLQLASAFAFLATSLAMLGLYGVMAFGVARRTREIGIRIALGAGSGSIRGMVLREVLLMLGVGALLGVPAALGLSRYAETQLFGVKPFDLMVVTGALAALAMAALMAGWLPARRAVRVNPVEALRYE